MVQKTDDIKKIEAWHGADVYFHIALNIMVSFAIFVFAPIFIFSEAPHWISGTVFGFMMVAARQLFMTTTLNRVRNRKTFYIGTTSRFDKKVNKYAWLIYSVSFIVFAASIYYFLHKYN